MRARGDRLHNGRFDIVNPVVDPRFLLLILIWDSQELVPAYLGDRRILCIASDHGSGNIFDAPLLYVLVRRHAFASFRC